MDLCKDLSSVHNFGPGFKLRGLKPWGRGVPDLKLRVSTTWSDISRISEKLRGFSNFDQTKKHATSCKPWVKTR